MVLSLCLGLPTKATPPGTADTARSLSVLSEETFAKTMGSLLPKPQINFIVFNAIKPCSDVSFAVSLSHSTISWETAA